MTHDLRQALPLLLTGTVAPVLALTGCASAPSVPGPQTVHTSPQLALAAAVGVIPAAARLVTLSMNYGMNVDGRKPPAPVTITDSAKVSDLAALVGDQPPFPPGRYSCPFGDDTTLDLTFRANPGGPVLATADLQLNGCGTTDLTVSGEDYVLGDPDSARPLADEVLKDAGVSWTLPPLTWPAG